MNIFPTPFPQTDLQAYSNVAHYSINVLLRYYKAHILYITQNRGGQCYLPYLQIFH